MVISSCGFMQMYLLAMEWLPPLIKVSMAQLYRMQWIHIWINSMHLDVMQFSRVMVLCIWGVALVQVLSFASSHFRALVASLIVVCTKLAHASLVWILQHGQNCIQIIKFGTSPQTQPYLDCCIRKRKLTLFIEKPTLLVTLLCGFPGLLILIQSLFSLTWRQSFPRRNHACDFHNNTTWTCSF